MAFEWIWFVAMVFAQLFTNWLMAYAYGAVHDYAAKNDGFPIYGPPTTIDVNVCYADYFRLYDEPISGGLGHLLDMEQYPDHCPTVVDQQAVCNITTTINQKNDHEKVKGTSSS